MTKVTTGVAGAVRIVPLKMNDLALAENHGKRLDESSKSRLVYPNVPPLTTTGLDLKALYKKHVNGVFIPKNSRKALHVIVQFPTQLVDGEDGEYMLRHARGFAEKVFGARAIFADRLDRDETGRHMVDLFVAPIYEKVTKHTVKDAVGLSVHTKQLAEQHFPAAERRKKEDGTPRDINVYDIGRALQSALHHYLQHDMGLTKAVRGEPKLAPGPDWKAAEELARAEIEKTRTATQKELKLAEQTRAEAEAAKAAALKLEAEVKAERLRQEQSKAALQEAWVKLQQDQAEVQLQLAEAEEKRKAAKLAKEEASHALQQIEAKQAALTAEQRQLGTAVGLLARGLDERNGLQLRPDPYIERGFAVEQEKLRTDEVPVYRAWPAPLRQLGIIVAKMMEKIRAARQELLGRQKEADDRQAKLDNRELELAVRFEKLAQERRTLEGQADEAAKLMEVARRESDRLQKELLLQADWSQILTDLAEDKLQLIPHRTGGWEIVAGSRPTAPRLQERLKEPGPAWAEAALATMKTVEAGANGLATQEREVAELKAKLTKVVGMADRAFTVSQKTAVEAATKALSQDQHRDAWDAARRSDYGL